jgi:hypothetical protein
VFALPGLLALVAFDVMRPQEYVGFLKGIPLLHLAALLSGLGLVVDLRLGLTRLKPTPHLVFTVLFVAWCLVTTGLRNPAWIFPRAMFLLVPFTLYLLLAHGVQTFRVFEVVAALLLALSLGLSVVGVHQGFAPTACYRVTVDEEGFRWHYDGRPCKIRLDCEGDGAEPGADYDCEKVGLFGTSSVNGRVRFRGTLEDPNELAMVLTLAIPFAFAFLERRRSLGRLLLVVVTVGLVGLCTYFTQSRGGQLVFLSVLGVYFVKRVGIARGAIVGALLAAPILLFGGRSGGGAEASTMERIHCWWVGMHLFVASPVVGVGSGLFMLHHYLTAHNSYILAAAELGLPGMFLWSAVMYIATKIPFEALRAESLPVARTWALALLASMAGMLVGVMFLSFNYKELLWVYVALTGVLYGAVKRHDPGFEVVFGIKDALLVALVDVVLVVAFIGYTGLKLGW